MLYKYLQKEVVYHLIDIIYSDVQELYPDRDTLYEEFNHDKSIMEQVRSGYNNSIFYQSPSSLRTWMPSSFSMFNDCFITQFYVELLSYIVAYYSLGHSLQGFKNVCYNFS